MNLHNTSISKFGRFVNELSALSKKYNLYLSGNDNKLCLREGFDSLRKKQWIPLTYLNKVDEEGDYKWTGSNHHTKLKSKVYDG